MPTPFLKIELDKARDGQKSISFATPEKLKQWYADEDEFWTWLESGLLQIQANTVRDTIKNSLLDPIKGEIDVLIADPKDEPRRNALISRISDVYSANHFLLSADPRAKFLSKLKQDRNASVAAAAFVSYWGKPLNNPPTDPRIYEGFIEARLYGESISHTATAERDAVVQLRDELESELESLRTRNTDLENINTKLSEEFNATLKSRSDALVLLETESELALTKLHQSKDHDFTELEKFYREELATHATVTYWKNRAFWHLMGAIAFGFLFFGVIAAFGFAIREVAEALFGQSAQVHIVEQGAQSVKPSGILALFPEPARLSLLILYSTLGIWVTRIIARIFLSQLHLRTDATEKATMVLTYLALLQEKGMTVEDKHIVLAALFRPTSTGIVKDDAAPSFWNEIASRAKPQ